MSSDFRILGELEILQDGDRIELGSPRQRAVLARLLINPCEVVTTDRLVEDLWRGDPPETARHTLHVYVSRLRKVLDRDGARLERRGAGYRFAVEPEELDASRFEQLASEGRAALARRDTEGAAAKLRDALSMWRGAALTEFADEAFAREEGVRLDELRVATLEQRMWADLELDRPGEVVEELRDLTTQHPFRETFWEQLMLALYRSDRQAEALRVYQTARANLAEELGIEPGPALRGMEKRILAQDPSLYSASSPRSVRPPGDLPLQRTSFVGRKRELARGAELLEKSRLLTLTGAPGSGKTRLALRLAGDHMADFEHGAFFIPLATVSNPRLMGRAVARVLGLREVPGESALDGLRAFLRDRGVLLILDNFEQIIQAAPQVGELLDAAPDLKIMVTSRASLGISGEQEFPVPPLGIPPVDELLDPQALATYDAVALFVTRARAADPNFDLNAENAEAVMDITIRLDGLPLAIELAAARVKLLTPQDLLGRLERRLTVLTGGPADSVGRHRTMRDAIAWSYELLETEEQGLFRRLGVFVGGFTLEAAAAVVDLPDAETLEGVDSLISKSLLYRPVDVGRARFAMLEMTREFAREKLASAGDAEEVAKRQALYFCRLAEEIEPQLTKDPGGVGTHRLAAEADNIRSALRYALEAGDPNLGLSLGSCLWRFWQSSDHLTEGREWLDRLLAHPEAADEVRVKGLTALAGLAYWQADYDGALARYSEALEFYRAQGDRFHEADTLSSMSLTAVWNGDLEAGERLATEALSILEELGYREGIARVTAAQGFLLLKRDDFAASLTSYSKALAIARELGDQHLAITVLVGVAVSTFQLGDRNEALALALEAVEEAVQLRNVHLAVWMLDLVAAFAAGTAPEAATRLAGAVACLRDEAGGGMLLEPLGLKDVRSVAAPLLSAQRLERAWAEGRAMGLEQATDLARELGGAVSMS